ncbi:MAG: hypothetical protein K5695_18270 [Oscillospiraceae bacterium]|nr:hypothetical protein [Oscillospiraceae bacterium]
MASESPATQELIAKIQAAAPLINRLEEIEASLKDDKAMFFISGTVMQPNIPVMAFLWLFIGAVVGLIPGVIAFELTDSLTVLLIVLIAVAIAGAICGIFLSLGDKKRADALHAELQRRIEALEMERSDILHSAAYEALPEAYRNPERLRKIAAALQEEP